jgi:hypothetical protein
VVAGNAYGEAHAAAAEKFLLSGVLVLDGERGVAWLSEPTLTQNLVRVVRTGESIGAYQLTKVFENRVELQGPEGPVMVPLNGGPGTPTATASAAPPPAQPQASVAPPSADISTQLKMMAERQKELAREKNLELRKAEMEQAGAAGYKPSNPTQKVPSRAVETQSIKSMLEQMIGGAPRGR